MEDIRTKKVINEVAKGSTLASAQRKAGYAQATIRSAKIQKTKKFKKAVLPIVQKLEDERNAIIERLKKTRNKAKYRDLMDGLDKTTKNIQLLTGGKTEDSHMTVSWEK